jgi:hypothetical protein
VLPQNARPSRVLAGDATGLLPALVASAPGDAAACVMHTAFLAHLTTPNRADSERQLVATSAERPVYWISAETLWDPNGPRLQLATCENGTVTSRWPLARFQSHGAWLEWTADGHGMPGATG